MPIIDLQCHLGLTDATRALAPPPLNEAQQYADTFGVELLCFTARESVTDLSGGNEQLAQALAVDKRFRGWLSLSVHQMEYSQQLAAHYFRSELWVGARFEQETEADAVDAGGGPALLNALRRYGKPILLTVNSPRTLHAAIEAAREFHTLRFIVAPQNEELAGDLLPMIKEILNISVLPCAALVERDMLAQAVTTLGERGERRVLWASDWGRLHPTADIGIIKDSAITNAHRERILYRNAHELLHQ